MRRAALLIALAAVPLAAQQPARPTTLRVIGINDFHGALTAWQDGARGLRGGAPAFVATIRAAERECVAPGCVSIIVDGGDMFQGTLLSNLNYGRTVLEMYNKLGVAAAALGNHEFDWTIDTLRARMRDAHFGIFGANVQYADGRDVEWIRDDTIVTRGTLRIGIVGLASTETPTTTLPSNVVTLRFAPLAGAVHAHAASLKARGADVVLVIGHISARCNDDNGVQKCSGDAINLARDAAADPIDAIVAGHSHTLVSTQVGDIPVVEALSSGRAIAVMDIPIGPTGPVRSAVKREIRQIATDSVKGDAETEAWLAAKIAALAPVINRKLGTLAGPAGTVYRADSGTANLVAEGYRAAGKADIGVVNNGGVRRPVYAGAMTYSAAFDVMPFQNHLIRFSMTAQAFREYAEKFVRGSGADVHVAGVHITFDPSKPAGARVVSITRANGAAIADGTMLTVVINNFMEEDGDGLAPPKSAANRADLGVDLDGFVAYVQSFGTTPIQPATAPNVVRVR